MPQRHTGKSSHSRAAASSEGACAIQPSATQPSVARANAPASARAMLRNSCSAASCGRKGAGKKRSMMNMAPIAASQPVSAKFTGSQAVFHSGRARTTISSAPV